MLARVLASLLCLVGAAAIALGVASATVWRGSDTLVASAQAADGSTLVVIEQGVLATGADEVRIEAAAGPGDTVVLAMGRTLDVEAWVGSDAHTVVTGLADWTTLSVRDVPSTADDEAADDAVPDDAVPDDATTDDAVPDDATTDDAVPDDATTDDAATDDTTTDDAVPDDAATDDTATGDAATDDEPAPASSAAPDPTGSDLWLEETTGARTATMDWDRRDGRWSLLVASTGENPTAPTLTLTWPREVTTPWLWPGVAGGAFLLLVGAAWWALLIVTARRSAAAAETRGRHGRRSVGSGQGSLVEPVVPSKPVVPNEPAVPDEHARPPEPATEVADPAQVPASEPSGAPVEAPLTRRQLRELERLRSARGAAGSSSGDTAPPKSTVPSPEDPSAAVPATEQAPSSGSAPAQPTGRGWSPAWRATVVGAPGHSPTEAGDSGPQVTWHPDAPSAAEPGTDVHRTELPEPDADRDAGRSQRWGERIAEHVPHLTRRARRAEQESVQQESVQQEPVQQESTQQGSTQAGSPGTGTATPPSGTGTAAPPVGADSAPSQRPHEARSASADAWRRAWGFPAAGEANDPDGSTDGRTDTDRDGGRP